MCSVLAFEKKKKTLVPLGPTCPGPPGYDHNRVRSGGEGQREGVFYKDSQILKLPHWPSIDRSQD